jgi:hypothetical protein
MAIAPSETMIRLSCTFAANCSALRTEFMFGPGASQKMERKVKDKTPRVMATGGRCIRDWKKAE